MTLLLTLLALIAFVLIWFCGFIMGYVFYGNSLAENERRWKKFEDKLFCLIRKDGDDE